MCHSPGSHKHGALKTNVKTVKFPWSVREEVRVTGYLWSEDRMVGGADLAGFIGNQTACYERFSEWFGKQNGQFSAIVEQNGEIWLGCSHTWSYPLFYLQKGDVLAVTDDPEHLLPAIDKPVADRETRNYFLNFGVTPAGYTIVPDLMQVRPGETVLLKGGSSQHTLSPIHTFSGTRNGTSEELARLIREEFGKYAGFLKDKEILLPLTRGYDSRLLACLLKEFGLTKVTCATWGRPANRESPTARRVAETQGFPHIFIPYSTDTFHRDAKEEMFDDYIGYAGHYSSMPFLQDYFAIRHLLREGVIHAGTAVLPGHPGDFIRGAHLFPSLPGKDDISLANAIISAFGNSYPATHRERDLLRKTITREFPEKNTAKTALQKFDLWDYEERQCKLIGNSSLVYDFFKISHLSPLFDKNIMGRFLQLPFGQRLGCSLYYETLTTQFFSPHGLDFDLRPAYTKPAGRPAVIETLIKLVPRFLKKIYYPLDDDVFYREFTVVLMRSSQKLHYRHPLKPHFYNCYLTQWYLAKVESRLKNNPGADFHD